MNSLEDMRDILKVILGFDDATELEEMLSLYRKLDSFGNENQKHLDVNSDYGRLFLLSIFLLLKKIRDRLSSRAYIESVGLPPQLKETLHAIRSDKSEPGSIIWYEKTFPLSCFSSPKNWEERLDREYDPADDTYEEAIDEMHDEVCHPVRWKYRREAIPAAVFKSQLPELPARLISDLKNLFGFGYFLHVVVLSRMALEASLKETLGDVVGVDLKQLIEDYNRKKLPNKRIYDFMEFIRTKGNRAIHSLTHIRSISNQEEIARECIIKLIYCMEEIYK